jgi:Rieske Fe-S protein
VLLGAGLAGGATLAGCSTAAVPYDANEQGQAPGAPPVPSTTAQASGTTGSSAPAKTGGGTVLGMAADIPVGGGKVFTAAKVVVTQPVKGEFKAFSAVCTHVGCLCNVVANGTINCPCHGSEFKITNGAVVTGPAGGPLPAANVAVTDGKIVLS